MIKVIKHREMESCNIQFEFHGYTLSVLVGKGSYSETVSNSPDLIESKNVEIAVLDDKWNFILPEQVIGHQSMQAFSRIMEVMSNGHETQEALVTNILAVID